MVDPTPERTVAFNEYKRQIEHMVPVGLAFFLRFLNLWQAILLVSAGLAYGVFLSGRVVRGTQRESDLRRGFAIGKASYALVILGLLLAFYPRMHVVAGAWAVLALGDGPSTIFGKAFGRRKLPWNRHKSWVGMAAFALFGGLGAALLVWWSSADPIGARWALLLGFFASAPSAVVESLPLPIDDNISVAVTAGVLLFVGSHIWL